MVFSHPILYLLALCSKDKAFVSLTCEAQLATLEILHLAAGVQKRILRTDMQIHVIGRWRAMLTCSAERQTHWAVSK